MTISPEAAAVIIAADRVVDLPTSEWMLKAKATFRQDEINPAIIALREAVLALRKKREELLARP